MTSKKQGVGFNMEELPRKKVLERIAECEKKGEFDKHVDPIDYDNYYKVDENFHYIKVGFREKFKNWFLYNFVVKPFTKKINEKDYQTTVIGRENIANLDRAIVTCNHVFKFDCLVAQYGFKGRNLFITAAEFNNQKGKFGDYMRAGLMMPMGNFGALRNFNIAIKKRLEDNNFILFYPEQAMWYNYRKVRPYKIGAFYYAVKHNVPIVPTFITFTDRAEVDKEGLPLQRITYNILPPIYPKQGLSSKENEQYLLEETHKACVKKYEEFYKIPLTFDTVDTKEFVQVSKGVSL